MNMNMGNHLSSMLPLVHHQSIAMLQPFHFGDLGSSYQQFPQNGFMPLLSLGNASESVFVFGDDKDMGGGGRVDISKGEDEFVLEYNLAGDLLLE
jgi:hypothetical protein